MISQTLLFIRVDRKRHENVDYTFQYLCPLLDKIFDTSDAPGGTQYDCCYQEYTGTTGSIGEVFMCEKTKYT